MSRGKRKLGENVWYEIRTALNDIEPLFWSGYAVWLLARVLGELSRLFPVEIRGLRFNGAMVTFYIRPKEGLKLPEIIKWIKLTFAVRFNLLDGRTGHIWGDRYWSRILDGEPPEWAEVYEFIEIDLPVRRGDWRREAARIGGGATGGTGSATCRPTRTRVWPPLWTGAENPVFRPGFSGSPTCWRSSRPRAVRLAAECAVLSSLRDAAKARLRARCVRRVSPGAKNRRFFGIFGMKSGGVCPVWREAM